jgi:hypothetical protein
MYLLKFKASFKALQLACELVHCVFYDGPDFVSR